MAGSNHSSSTGIFRLFWFFPKLEIYANYVYNHEKFGGRLFLSKKITVANVKNMFMKGVTQNHCLGLRFSCNVLSRDLRQTRLKE